MEIAHYAAFVPQNAIFLRMFFCDTKHFFQWFANWVVPDGVLNKAATCFLLQTGSPRMGHSCSWFRYKLMTLFQMPQWGI